MKFDDFLEEQLKEPNFRAEYEALEPDYAIVEAILNARLKRGYSQEEIAKKAGMSKRKLEEIQMANANPSLSTLKSLAKAINMKLKIEFVPIPKQQQ